MRLTSFVAIALAVTLNACSSSSRAVSQGVTQESRYLLSYEGPEAVAEVEYRMAKHSLGGAWLVFKLSLASTGDTVAVDREGVRVRAPDGQIFALIGQEEFRSSWGVLRANLERSNAWGPPTDRFAYFRRPCERWLLAPPGASGSFLFQEPLIVNANQWCSGPLVFEVPVGVQPGRWLLMIDFTESEARIPFELEGPN